MAGSVLIVDDNALMRRTLRQVFTSQPDFDVCGEAENGREAVEKAQELYPDLIVMDLSMPVMNGIEAARALKRLMPSVPINSSKLYLPCSTLARPIGRRSFIWLTCSGGIAAHKEW